MIAGLAKRHLQNRIHNDLDRTGISFCCPATVRYRVAGARLVSVLVLDHSVLNNDTADSRNA